MANVLFDEGRAGFLTAEIDWDDSGIKMVLVESGTYVLNQSHKFVSDVTGAGAVVASTTALLTGKTFTAGVANCDNPTFPSVAAGPACSIIIVYQSTAVGDEVGGDVAATAQRLIGYVDSATNLPVTPSGIDIGVTINAGPNGLFKL